LEASPRAAFATDLEATLRPQVLYEPLTGAGRAHTQRAVQYNAGPHGDECYNALMPVDTRLTYDDFCLLPNNGKRYEIVEGELFVTPAPRLLHQKIVLRLGAALMTFVEREGLGQVFAAPVDIVLSEFDVVEPDIVYISKARAAVMTERNVQGAPDLAVEVLSETTEKTDRTIKLKLYGRFGVQEYWIIEPYGPSLEIYRRGPGGLDLAATLTAADSLTSPLFPGFSLPVARLTE